jgi:protein gp37
MRGVVAQNSSIEWTDSTWNPVTGCTKISPGCKHCYAERMAIRLAGMMQPRYRNGFEVTLQPDLIRTPLGWHQPRVIFVNSMSDLFHEDIPILFIAEIFETMVAAHWHIFQILTKRADRLAEVAAQLPWPINVWMGVSVESPRYVHRIEHLRSVPAAVRFLSIEPLLAPFQSLPLADIDWVIVGGESGPGARPMSPDWVRQIRDVCVERGVPFFFKQWGGTRKIRTGRSLDDRTWDDMPTPVLRWRPSASPGFADSGMTALSITSKHSGLKTEERQTGTVRQ